MDRIKKKVNKIGFLWALVSIILFIGLYFALIGLADFLMWLSWVNQDGINPVGAIQGKCPGTIKVLILIPPTT